ncbi:MAG: HPr kinase/phosphatase C-terminal domain-containing protein [Defluviimonas sp.]|nr:HPr kinase/phosphatase C-terminal domain-containing protein [Defluviimonas sp.]
MTPAPASLILHATTVARAGRGVVILGPSGSGKSGLALQLMALGAALVADDQTILHRRANGLFATCPAAIRGRIEARGVGILAAEAIHEAQVCLSVDLGVAETERLPPPRSIEWLGVPIALVHGAQTAHFPAAIMQYLACGRLA